MKCSNCGFDNEDGARFCGSCGQALATPPPIPSAPPVGSGTTLQCPNCGTGNTTDSAFCKSCGARLSPSQAAPPPRATTPARTSAPPPAIPTTAARPATGTQQKKLPTSAAWWLMPILLAWVGGLIGFLVVRDSDKGKANGLLILGIIMTVFWIVLSIGLSALSFFAWY